MPSRILPRQPSQAAKSKLRWVLNVIRWPLITILRLRGTRLSWSGAEHLPSNSPILIVSNHVNQLDPVMLTLASNRPIHFLATQAILQEPFLSRFCVFFGAVFKKKFTADMSAIRSLRAWNKVGSIVGLFPEGERSWDGRLLSLVPGTERLVTLLDVPLVTARIINADRIWPRWSPHPRNGRVHIEFDAPVYFSRKTPIESIRRYIVERITVNTKTESIWQIHGHDLASGLANPLFACPQCLKCNSLSEHGDEIHCSNCTAIWHVDSTNSLVGNGRTPNMSIGAALDHLHEYLENVDWRPNHEQSKYEESIKDQSLLSSEPMQLWDYTQEPFFQIGSGILKLMDSRLFLQSSDGTELWSIPLSAIRVVSVELRRRLQIRTSDQLFEAQIPTESVVLWELMIRHWANLGVQNTAQKKQQTISNTINLPSVHSE